ncbi:MAG TPA: serine/threonine-protein kinase [Ktedonobacteraceae bacterium]
MPFQSGGQKSATHGMLLHGRYRLGATLGLGGYSAVYRGWDTQEQEREIALKQITLQGLSAEETIEATSTYNREIEALSSLNHSQVPRLYAHFSDSDHWYLVLEYIKGQTLEAFLSAREAQHRLLNLEEILGMGLQLCTVLEYLHTRHPPLIFRDLKPSNIMRTPSGKLYLIDFGIARRYTLGQSRDTQSLGSPGYAAPEQYGRAQTDARADLYSLGALLQQLLTGHDPSQLRQGLLPSRLNGQTGNAELEALIACLLAVNPQQRTSTASDLSHELEGIRQLEIAARQVGRIWQPPVPQTYSSSVADAAFSAAQIQLQQMTAKSVAMGQGPIRRKHVTRRRVLLTLGASATIIGGGWWLSGLRVASESVTTNALQKFYTYNQHNASILSIAWTLDGQSIVSASQDRTMRIWNALTGEDVSGPYTFPGAVNSVSSSFAGIVAAGCQDGTVSAWDASGSKIFEGKHKGAVNSVAWASDGMYLASSSEDMSLRVWDISGKTSLVHKEDGVYYGVAWSPNAVYLAAANSLMKTVESWIANDLSILYNTYSGHMDISYTVAWSPDGQYIAAGCQDSSVLVWDSHTRTVLTSYIGHTALVRALCWLPGGGSIASASDDGTVQVWDALSGSIYGTYTGHNAPVFTVAWSPDGHYLASAGEDQTVQIWGAP